MAQHGRIEWQISAVKFREKNTKALQGKTRFSSAVYLEEFQLLDSRIFRECYLTPDQKLLYFHQTLFRRIGRVFSGSMSQCRLLIFH
jgi:hypothetical protein